MGDAATLNVPAPARGAIFVEHLPNHTAEAEHLRRRLVLMRMFSAPE